jgi:hypothetical protein
MKGMKMIGSFSSTWKKMNNPKKDAIEDSESPNNASDPKCT